MAFVEKNWVSALGTQSLPNPPIEMPGLIWQVLYGRGIQTSNAIEGIYSPSLKDLSNPLSLDGMAKAVERLVTAFKKGEKVCIYADFDLDGTPGLALLKQGLEWLGFTDLIYYQPKRLSEGYGLHPHLMESFAEQGVKLIVTVDVGITAIEAVDEANTMGIDVVITDHHLPKETLPNAVAVVNPNKEECQSGLGHLCGAGVAFYLVLALRASLREQELLKKDFNPKLLLDCFAIATITDMVPLVKENRTLVKHGLIQLENTKRPGLKALLSAVDLSDRKITSQDVGFRFAPKLNALSRMERGLLPIDVFLSESKADAESLIDEVLQNNEERVTLQKEAEREAMAEIGKPTDGFVWVYSRNFHKGIVGLVATKMAQMYNVPAFVGALDDKGHITASARLPGEEGSLLDALEVVKDFLDGFGGHAAAAGFHLYEEKGESVREGFKNFFAEEAAKSLVPRDLQFDGEGNVEDLHGTFMSWYEGLGPFGIDFEAPIFRLKNVKLRSVRELKGGHLKLGLVSKEQKAQVDGLWFSPPANNKCFVKGLEIGDDVEVLGEPQWNYFAGRKTLQLLIKDLKVF